MHGADRPGGNNLIDTQVFGYRVGRAAAEAASRAGKERRDGLREVKIPSLSREEETLLERSADLFYSNLTIVRTKSGLEEVLHFVNRHRSNPNPLVQNRLGVGEILATSALTREESRGHTTARISRRPIRPG